MTLSAMSAVPAPRITDTAMPMPLCRTTLPIADLGMINGLATLARQLKSDRIVQLSISPADVAIDSEDGSDIYWNRSDIAVLVARWQAGPSAASNVEPTPSQRN